MEEDESVDAPFIAWWLIGALKIIGRTVNIRMLVTVTAWNDVKISVLHDVIEAQ